MTLQNVLRSIAVIVAVLLLLGVAWTGISGGIEQWPQWNTLATRVQSAAQILGGVCAIFILITRFKWHSLRRVSELGFVAGCVVAAGLAPVVWSGESVTRGLLGAAAALVITGAIVWMFRVGAGSFGIMKEAEN